MSQRLAEVAVEGSANGYVRRHMSDPYWTTPLGYTKNGKPFYPVAGADGTDNSNGETGGAGGAGGTGSGSGSEGQNGGTGDNGAGGNNSGAGDKDSTGTTVSKEEYDKVMERMKAADRNSAEALRKLKELEEKDLSEQEKVLKRVPELEEQVKTLSVENTQLKAKVAFLGTEGTTWHDPDVALGQVDLTDVMKEDGTVDKALLKKNIEKLAKDKPFLVKAAADGKDGKDGAGGNGSGQGSSGQGVGSGNGGAGSQNALDEAALRKKYPALN